MQNQEPISKCCKKKMLVETADEGTSCWICSGCRNATDPYVEESIPMNKEQQEFCERHWCETNQDALEKTLSHQRSSLISSILKRLEKELLKIKKRYRCAACDGAKCEHTQCCQAISSSIEIIKSYEHKN